MNFVIDAEISFSLVVNIFTFMCNCSVATSTFPTELSFTKIIFRAHMRFKIWSFRTNCILHNGEIFRNYLRSDRRPKDKKAKCQSTANVLVPDFSFRSLCLFLSFSNFYDEMRASLYTRIHTYTRHTLEAKGL